jgi:hypothetical protein
VSGAQSAILKQAHKEWRDAQRRGWAVTLFHSVLNLL